MPSTHSYAPTYARSHTHTQVDPMRIHTRSVTHVWVCSIWHLAVSKFISKRLLTLYNRFNFENNIVDK